MDVQIACGIDVGFSGTRATSAISSFLVEPGASGSCIKVQRETVVLTTESLHQLISERACPLDDERLRLVTLDAPLTLTCHVAIPERGRHADRRFSRGPFANSNRGPQPSSIRVPRQGWPLYLRGMQLLRSLGGIGFPYIPMPRTAPLKMPWRGTMEVLPKLTLALLCPRTLLCRRPKAGFYRQIDNWLFPHVFLSASNQRGAAREARIARGVALDDAKRCLGRSIRLGDDVYHEAERIDRMPNAQRHEAVGAFVAGLQGALALAGAACAVGDGEAHFLLPRTWHPDWEAAWTNSERQYEPVPRICVLP